jgi:hypothetical protein
MRPQIVTKHETAIPAWIGGLHEVDVMGPGPGNALAEEQLIGKPRLVFRHIRVAEGLQRLDAGRPGIVEAAHADQEIDDRLGGQPGHRSASHVLNRNDERAERGNEFRAFLLEHRRPGRIVVGYDNPSASVALHGPALLVDMNGRVLAKAVDVHLHHPI